MSAYEELARRTVEAILDLKRQTAKTTEYLQEHYVLEISQDVFDVLLEANKGRPLSPWHATFFGFQIVIVAEGHNVLTLSPKGK